MSEKKILKATHEGTLPIGDVTLNVAVLEDGTRVISQSSIFKAFGRIGNADEQRQILECSIDPLLLMLRTYNPLLVPIWRVCSILLLTKRNQGQ